MSPRFCKHLEEYGSLYTRAEAAYIQCNNLVDRVLDEGPDVELVESLTAALEEWLEGAQELRTALLDLVADGKVRIPKKKCKASHRQQLTICSECKFKIPTLKFPEWKFAENGTVSFRGEDLPLEKPAELVR